MGVAMVAFSQSEQVIRTLYKEPWVGVSVVTNINQLPSNFKYAGVVTNLKNGSLDSGKSEWDCFFSRAVLPLNQDCYVDLIDFAVLSQHWLDCSDPDVP